MQYPLRGRTIWSTNTHYLLSMLFTKAIKGMAPGLSSHYFLDGGRRGPSTQSKSKIEIFRDLIFSIISKSAYIHDKTIRLDVALD